jgi:hypothetical protein
VSRSHGFISGAVVIIPEFRPCSLSRTADFGWQQGSRAPFDKVGLVIVLLASSAS